MMRIKKVLVVEDEYGKAKAVERILKELEIEYCLKEAVKEATEAVENDQFDLLITDLGLPKSEGSPFIKKEDSKNGLKMLLDLEKLGIRIPAIIYSTNLLSKADEEALKECGGAFIAQVIDSAEIEWYIRREFEINGSG